MEARHAKLIAIYQIFKRALPRITKPLAFDMIK